MKIAIIGTGNIGTDLLLKSLREDFIEIVAFVGRRLDSDGMNVAKKHNIFISDEGINYFINHPKCCDLVFDCTNAIDAKYHAKIFKEQGIKVIDLTPAQVGKMCVPDINANLIITEDNVNMITCGGQASLPLLHLIKKYCTGLEYIEIVSQISSKSAGMATRINIDNYIYTTQNAITEFTGCKNCKVIINLNPAEPCVDMQTTIFIKTDNIDFNNLTENILEKIEELKAYIPYYDLVMFPKLDENNIVVLSIRVKGIGDYLPPYAGNLDIINCAAIKVAKQLI